MKLNLGGIITSLFNLYFGYLFFGLILQEDDKVYFVFWINLPIQISLDLNLTSHFVAHRWIFNRFLIDQNLV